MHSMVVSSKVNYRRITTSHRLRNSVKTLPQRRLILFLVHSFVTQSPWRPIYKYCSPNDIFSWQKAPNMAIQTVVSVIAKNKYCARRNSHWSKFVFRIFRSVRLLLPVSIYVQFPPFHLYLVTLEKEMGKYLHNNIQKI